MGSPIGSANVLDIEDGVSGVHGGLVLGSLTNQTLLLVEGDVRGGSEATLLVGNDFDIVALVSGDARVRSTYRRQDVSGVAQLKLAIVVGK